MRSMVEPRADSTRIGVRGRLVVAADGPDDGPAVELGEHQVEHDQRRAVASRSRRARPARRRPSRRVTRRAPGRSARAGRSSRRRRRPGSAGRDRRVGGRVGHRQHGRPMLGRRRVDPVTDRCLTGRQSGSCLTRTDVLLSASDDDPPGDVDAAVAGLQARWGAAAPRVVGALALAPPAPADDPRRPTPGRRSRHSPDDAGSSTPASPRSMRSSDRAACRRSASVAIRGDGSSGRTTLALRVAAEAQAAGLGRRLAGPVAQLRSGRGRRPRHPPRMARRHHPGQPGRGPDASPAACWPAARWTCSSSTCPAAGWPGPTRRPASPTGSIDSPRSPGARRRCS